MKALFSDHQPSVFEGDGIYDLSFDRHFGWVHINLTIPSKFCLEKLIVQPHLDVLKLRIKHYATNIESRYEYKNHTMTQFS